MMSGEFEGIFFNDSDVYKWVEAASYTLSTHPNPVWEAELDEVIAKIAASQQPDGYLNTYFTLVERRSGGRISASCTSCIAPDISLRQQLRNIKRRKTNVIGCRLPVCRSN